MNVSIFYIMFYTFCFNKDFDFFGGVEFRFESSSLVTLCLPTDGCRPVLLPAVEQLPLQCGVCYEVPPPGQGFPGRDPGLRGAQYSSS